MADTKKYIEKTEVETETKRSTGSPKESEYRKETIVRREREVEKDDDTVVVVEHD